MRPNKKFLLILIFIAVTVGTISGQEVVATSGDHHAIPGYAVSWTLGEPVIATGSSGSYSLTQGFHQPKLTVTSTDILAIDLNIKVYPNPAQEFVTINSEQLLENARYALFSLSGEKLMEGKIRSSTTRLNLEKMASGTYILKLSGENNRPLQTYKIVKR